MPMDARNSRGFYHLIEAERLERTLCAWPPSRAERAARPAARHPPAAAAAAPPLLQEVLLDIVATSYRTRSTGM